MWGAFFLLIVRWLCGAICIMRMYGRDANGVLIPPVHAGLHATAHDQHPYCRLHMPRSDVVSFFSELAITHALLAPFKIMWIAVAQGILQRGLPVREADHAPRAAAAARKAMEFELRRHFTCARPGYNVRKGFGPRGVAIQISVVFFYRSTPPPARW